MKKEFEASLEDAIQKWIDENCDDLSDLYNFYYHPGLVEQMATAATQVLDSCIESQEYAKQEKSITGENMFLTGKQILDLAIFAGLPVTENMFDELESETEYQIIEKDGKTFVWVDEYPEEGSMELRKK